MTDSEKIEILQKDVTSLLKLNKEMLKVIKTIGKALHIINVTEKEEKEIQLLQRKNLNQAAKVNDDLNKMENKITEDTSLGNLFSSIHEVYGDVLAEDVLGDGI